VRHGNPLRLQIETLAQSAEQHTYTYSTAGAPWGILVRWSNRQNKTRCRGASMLAMFASLRGRMDGWVYALVNK